MRIIFAFLLKTTGIVSFLLTTTCLLGADAQVSLLYKSASGGQSNKAVTATEGNFLTFGVNGIPESTVLEWDLVTDTPTTLAGYGITDAQAINTLLTNISALNGASGSYIRFTGTNTVEVRTDSQTWSDLLTASGLTLTGSNTGDQTPTSLGLVIGTNVQAYDADLTTWAGVTSTASGRNLVTIAGTADRIPYLSATDTWSLANITSYGLSLLAAEDANEAGIPPALNFAAPLSVDEYDEVSLPFTAVAGEYYLTVDPVNTSLGIQIKELQIHTLENVVTLGSPDRESAGNTQGVRITTGIPQDGNSGNISVESGEASGNSGSVRVGSGSAGNGSSGDVTVSPGYGESSGGDITIEAGSSGLSAGDLYLGGGPNSGGEGGLVNIQGGVGSDGAQRHIEIQSTAIHAPRTWTGANNSNISMASVGFARPKTLTFYVSAYDTVTEDAGAWEIKVGAIGMTPRAVGSPVVNVFKDEDLDATVTVTIGDPIMIDVDNNSGNSTVWTVHMEVR